MDLTGSELVRCSCEQTRCTGCVEEPLLSPPLLPSPSYLWCLHRLVGVHPGLLAATTTCDAYRGLQLYVVRAQNLGVSMPVPGLSCSESITVVWRFLVGWLSCRYHIVEPLPVRLHSAERSKSAPRSTYTYVPHTLDSLTSDMWGFRPHGCRSDVLNPAHWI